MSGTIVKGASVLTDVRDFLSTKEKGATLRELKDALGGHYDYFSLYQTAKRLVDNGKAEKVGGGKSGYGGRYRLKKPDYPQVARKHYRSEPPATPARPVRPPLSAGPDELIEYAGRLYDDDQRKSGILSALKRIRAAGSGIALNIGQISSTTGLTRDLTSTLLEELINYQILDRTANGGYSFGTGKRAPKPPPPFRLDNAPRFAGTETKNTRPSADAEPVVITEPPKAFEPTDQEWDLIRAVHHYGNGSVVGLRILSLHHKDVGMPPTGIAKSALRLAQEGYLIQTAHGYQVSDKSAEQLGVDNHVRRIESDAITANPGAQQYTGSQNERILKAYHDKQDPAGHDVYMQDRILQAATGLSADEIAHAVKSGLLVEKRDGLALTGYGKKELTRKYGD